MKPLFPSPTQFHLIISNTAPVNAFPLLIHLHFSPNRRKIYRISDIARLGNPAFGGTFEPQASFLGEKKIAEVWVGRVFKQT